MVWKSHDDSIAQRSAIDQARHEKAHETKRRSTMHDDAHAEGGKGKTPAS
jgi:translation initiation factor 4E